MASTDALKMVNRRKTGNRKSVRGVAVSGEMLRMLRDARGWTQEAAATQANLSDRLIRKAESGGRVDLETVSTLASLYSSPHRQISPADLIKKSSIAAAGEPLDEVLVLRCWMDEIWNKRHLEVLEGLAADGLCFQCESGVVTTRRELQDRYRRIQRQYSRVDCHLEELAGSNGLAVCRWKMSMWRACPERVDCPIQGAIKVSGTTSVQVESGKVVAGSEFWHPQHAYQTIVES